MSYRPLLAQEEVSRPIETSDIAADGHGHLQRSQRPAAAEALDAQEAHAERRGEKAKNDAAYDEVAAARARPSACGAVSRSWARRPSGRRHRHVTPEESRARDVRDAHPDPSRVTSGNAIPQAARRTRFTKAITARRRPGRRVPGSRGRRDRRIVSRRGQLGSAPRVPRRQIRASTTAASSRRSTRAPARARSNTGQSASPSCRIGRRRHRTTCNAAGSATGKRKARRSFRFHAGATASSFVFVWPTPPSTMSSMHLS